MSDEFAAIFEAPIDAPPDLDELVRATMAWHFSPATGSPYWVARASEFSFNPLTDVQTYADLALFESVPMDWSTIPATSLVPLGCRGKGGRFGVFESGGTTGAPKRIVDNTSRVRNIEFQNLFLEEQGFPRGQGDEGWLHIGPTGPHIMAKNVGNVAAFRGFLAYFVDLDPRWVKRCIASGRDDTYKAYLDHILDQVKDVLESQNIKAISTTPKVLDVIVGRPDVYDVLAEKVRGIIWGGTSIDAETLRLLRDEAFPDAVLAGAYGNTMMGMAPQRTPRDDDGTPCVFRPFYPYAVVEVVDEQEFKTPVAVGESGVVKVSALTRDLFVPPVIERDKVTRRATEGYPGVEVSDVRPREMPNTQVIEGVY